MKFFTAICVIIFLPGCTLFQSKPEPVTVVAPTSVSTTIAPADSSYLVITLGFSLDTTEIPRKSDNAERVDNGNDYSIALQGKSLSHINLDQVDSFLKQHKQSIDTNKVFVRNRTATAVIFERLTAVLKKAGIVKFRIVSQ